MTRYAYFVKRPRRVEDLYALHLSDDERRYSVVKTVTLTAIEYENFAADMLADRAFLEVNASSCGVGDVWQCLLVRQKGNKNGILMVPDGCFVKWAATVY